MKKPQILIIGKIPPPVGGTTVHVSRLTDHLKDSAIPFLFKDLRTNNVLHILRLSLSYKAVHLHASNVWLRFIFSTVSFFLKNKLIITFHGNLGRYSSFLNWIDDLSVKFAAIPIVINQNSYKRASKINSNTRLVSAFIPPAYNDLDSDPETNSSVQALKKKYTKVYCTNAFDVVFDKDGYEIYGISSLVKLFTTMDDCGLVVCDPSGNYNNYILKKKIFTGDNVKFLTFSYPFYHILKQTDGFIRSTTTDGDSLSVKEALYLGKAVFCSDCVDRPEGVRLFKTQNDDQLRQLLIDHAKSISHREVVHVANGFNDLEKLYQELL